MRCLPISLPTMNTRILGISFCTRMVGLAVLESDLLIDYSVKLYKDKWSPAKMDTILASLTSAVEHYNIKHIVLSIAPVYANSEPYQELWAEIVSHFYRLQIPVTSYRLDDLQQIAGCEQRMSRNSLMEALTGMYSELGFYAKIERRNKNKYYYKMFEAVGAATLYLKQNRDIETGEG